MKVVGQLTGAAVLAMASLGTVRLVARAQTGTAVPSQQAVPDAPKPQVLPSLNGITPTAPAVDARPQAPSAVIPATNRVADQAEPGTALPSAPSSSATRDTEEDAAPDIPAAGQGPGAIYRLGTVNVNFVDVPFTVKDSKGAACPWADLARRADSRKWTSAIPQALHTDPVPLSVALGIDQSVPSTR